MGCYNKLDLIKDNEWIDLIELEIHEFFQTISLRYFHIIGSIIYLETE